MKAAVRFLYGVFQNPA